MNTKASTISDRAGLQEVSNPVRHLIEMASADRGRPVAACADACTHSHYVDSPAYDHTCNK